MENKDTNYQKVARGPKIRNCRNYHFAFAFTIFYKGSFQVPPEKNHPHLEVLIPTQNPNSTYVPPISAPQSPTEKGSANYEGVGMGVGEVANIFVKSLLFLVVYQQCNNATL